MDSLFYLNVWNKIINMYFVGKSNKNVRNYEQSLDETYCWARP